MVLLSIFLAFYSPAAGGKETGGSITANLSGLPLTIDPMISKNDVEKVLLYNTHEGLVAWEKGLLVPAAAQKWMLSADGRTYTFYLRKRSWSNGDPVTARDFELSWKRLIRAADKGQKQFVTDIFKNAKAFRTGELLSLDEVGIRALDQSTLEVKLEEPGSYFLALLTQPCFFPVHPAYASSGNEEEEKYAPGYCSNGPFYIKEWNHKDYAILVPNRFYTGKKPLVDEVKFTFLTAETGFSLYSAGLIDLLESPPSAAFLNLDSELIQVPVMGTRYLYLNLRRSPLNKYLVRKALSLAIDRELLIKKVPGLSAVPATGLIPPGISDSKSGSDFRGTGGNLLDSADDRRALELLSSAGYPGEDGLPEIDLLVVEGGQREAMAKVIADMWKINLGLKVKIKAVNWMKYEELCSTGRFYTASAEWAGDYPDPMTFLKLFHSKAVENYSAYNDPEYDNWLSLAEERKDTAEKYRIYHALEEKVVGDLAIIPLYFTTKPYLVTSRVKDLLFTPDGYPLFYQARKMGN